MSNSLAASRPRGLTVFFTGLSGAGKSTLASVLAERLIEADPRPVTLLDGDAVRKQMSTDLGFSKADRDTHVRRVGKAAAEISQQGGIAICALIAPYANTRDEVRRLAEAAGEFVLVYMATPLDVCEQRDAKGLYAKARAGLIQHFTGVSDPYEVPADADIVIDTSHVTPAQAAATILDYVSVHGARGAHPLHGDRPTVP